MLAHLPWHLQTYFTKLLSLTSIIIYISLGIDFAIFCSTSSNLYSPTFLRLQPQPCTSDSNSQSHSSNHLLHSAASPLTISFCGPINLHYQTSGYKVSL